MLKHVPVEHGNKARKAKLEGAVDLSVPIDTSGLPEGATGSLETVLSIRRGGQLLHR